MPSLMDSIPSGYLSRLDSVQYLAAVVVILQMDRKLTDYYWMNIASDDVPFLGIIEHTNMLPKEWYNDHHVVYLTNYLHRRDELFSLPPEGVDGPLFRPPAQVQPQLQPLLGKGCSLQRGERRTTHNWHQLRLEKAVAPHTV